MGEKVERVKTKWKELDVDYFEDYLSGCSVFFRIHRSYLVNIKKVKSFKNTYVVMQNGDKIEMSRRRYADFCKRYADVCE